jgi:aspartate racemase
MEIRFMKTIGLLGGMTWLSTLEYYRIINETVKQELGGFHSARCVLYSFNFDDIKQTHNEEDWEEATRLMIDAARALKSAGADFIVICTNTMHKMADEVQETTGLPLVHIADATASAIKAMNINKVGLLGTRFTMEETFYKNRLFERHGIETVIPEEEDRQLINDIINRELGNGEFILSSKEDFKRIINRLEEKGAEGIILGCTEIPLLIKQEDYELPLFDTTTLHAEAAVKYALNGKA